MNPFATLTLAHHGLELRSGNLSEDHPVAADDCQRLQGWAERYLAAVGQDNHHAALLALGQEMHAWLNGPTSFLTRALKTGAAPRLVELVVASDDERELAKAWLNAPWELLASDGQFWALDPAKVFCPVRRIGEAALPPKPTLNRLGLVFMAAAPRGADNLNYEAEEISILNATRSLGLDLAVEESGTLELLSACVAREQPDVIQISCHGTLHPRPGLLLEDEVGDPQFASADMLLDELGGYHPRLLILSACETAQADSVLPSIARSLMNSGVPAVLGWAASVFDQEATIFASELYRRLTQGKDLAESLTAARRALANSDQLGPDGSRNWHLARLFLNPTGGGALATANGKQRHLGQGQAAKTFLDAKGKQVPVASDLEFVGRRREIQAILREFRAPDRHHAGVFIHGVGRQGKSSLAARVARRLEHTHETVVIYRRYDAPYILRNLGERLATPAVTEIIARHLPLVEADKANLLPALTELLEGPCAQTVKDDSGKCLARPILLIVDDFEQALEVASERGVHAASSPNMSSNDQGDPEAANPNTLKRTEVRAPGVLHRLKPEYFASIRALLLAFGAASTESHLLFTSRYQFTCPHDARDLADAEHLLDVPLHGMNERETQKQADAKLRLPEIARIVAKLTPKKFALLRQQMARSIRSARGNPGLQDLLFTLAVNDPAACDRCLTEMEQYLASGQLPAVQDKLREFLENLALDSLLALLTAPQRELLRAATLLELPVPVAVMRMLAERPLTPSLSPVGGEGARRAGEGAADAAISRLLALGLCEVYEDLTDPQTRALALNALVRPRAGTLTAPKQAALATVVTGALFEHWGGAEGSKQRSYLQDTELARLGLLARDAHALAACGADALRYLDEQFKYQQAADWAKAMLAIVDTAGVPASVRLLRTAAERCQQVGEMAEANAFRARAMELLGQGEETDPVQNAATLITHARALVDQGQPDEALRHLEQAQKLLPPGREQAIVLGEIARIRAAKGEVDAALRLHQELLKVYETLGDKQARAVTLGDIARLRAAKGEVDAALQSYQEVLHICEELGDKKGRAVTLGDIARLRADKGEVDAALRLHQEKLAIVEALGDKRSRAVTLGDIARLRAAKGEVDAALQLHQEMLGIFEALGDKRSRAVTLGDIARLRAAKGEVDAALQLHQEMLGIFEALGDLDGKANTLWSIAQIEMQQEKWQEAYNHLAESYDINLKLGRLDGICMVGLDLGQLLCRVGQREPGLEILTRSHAGFLKLGRTQKAQQTAALIAQIKSAAT